MPDAGPLASPRDPAMRVRQVSFRFEHGYAAMQALIARGVIGDFLGCPIGCASASHLSISMKATYDAPSTFSHAFSPIAPGIVRNTGVGRRSHERPAPL